MPSVASRRVLPLTLEPQLCTLVSEAPEGDEWLHEIKYDGWRLLARKEGNRVRLYTRGGHEWSARLPRLTAAIAALPLRSAWLDGELVVLDADGRSRFEPLAGALRSGNESRLFYQVWDMPWRNGRELCRLPLLERKAMLCEAIDLTDPRIRYTSHFVGNGAGFFAEVNALDLEGIVSKCVGARYYAGERTRHWLKVKCWRTHQFVIGGVERDDEGRLIALLVGSPNGGSLRFEGRVEFALSRVRSLIMNAPDANVSPFVPAPRARNATWWKPSHTIEVRALPRAANGLLRHATAVRVLHPR